MGKKLKKLFQKLGPGFITGASDDDPSGIATYAQAGASFGYQQLWTALFSAPLTIAVQEICGRIGLLTGKGLAANIKRHYPKPILWGAVLLLLVANTLNIGADLGAMASSLQLLLPVPYHVLLLSITFLTIVLEIFVPYALYARYLKFLALSLLAYVIAAFVVRQDWSAIGTATLLPTISFAQPYLMNLVAIFGTTISPYLFFWQTSEEVEEEVANHKLKSMGLGTPRVTKRDIRGMRWDTIGGMAFSNLIMFFIIMTAGSTLFRNGIHTIETAEQAAMALKPLAGDLTFLLFTAGIVGTGLLTVPILAGSASYAISETLGWKSGLSRKLARAHGFYGVIAIATIAGLLFNLSPVKPFTLLYYSAIVNGVIAPPLLFLIVAMGNKTAIVGKHTNSWVFNALGLFTAILMSVGAILLLISLVMK